MALGVACSERNTCTPRLLVLGQAVRARCPDSDCDVFIVAGRESRASKCCRSQGGGASGVGLMEFHCSKTFEASKVKRLLQAQTKFQYCKSD